jgi:hypothetical protein
MNQVEQWFSILQRKRLRTVDFSDTAVLAERLLALVSQWNEHAHPSNWSTKSATKVMAKCQISQAASLSAPNSRGGVLREEPNRRMVVYYSAGESGRMG